MRKSTLTIQVLPKVRVRFSSNSTYFFVRISCGTFLSKVWVLALNPGSFVNQILLKGASEVWYQYV